MIWRPKVGAVKTVDALKLLVASLPNIPLTDDTTGRPVVHHAIQMMLKNVQIMHIAMHSDKANAIKGPASLE